MANPANIRDYVDKKWYPSLELPQGLMTKVDFGYLIFVIIAVLVSLIVWKTDGILTVVMERGGAN